MLIPLARCFRGIVDHAADAIMPARLMITDWIYGPFPKPKPTGSAQCDSGTWGSIKICGVCVSRRAVAPVRAIHCNRVI